MLYWVNNLFSIQPLIFCITSSEISPLTYDSFCFVDVCVEIYASPTELKSFMKTTFTLIDNIIEFIKDLIKKLGDVIIKLEESKPKSGWVTGSIDSIITYIKELINRLKEVCTKLNTFVYSSFGGWKSLFLTLLIIEAIALITFAIGWFIALCEDLGRWGDRLKEKIKNDDILG